ncbi:branched-chain amino acid ABC transporter permease [Tardiphaga sp. vice304]|uniref:branched-chain amino acid ABC transporter permease n=1 Tax=Tardiphaga sp. vice304 TaxID=2592817 RepID=UPI0011645772|nr:branched-chain amino acid ABC transporter permease [Tardiphaga sp. vice304]QDM25954.1 branched-chain amino acid ABC transporter permease [Tardiphaga sp. vice304]
MTFSMDLLTNALVAGIMLGGFYCAVAVGITIAFGMLDVVNIAHPAFIITGGFIAYFFNTAFGFDPLLVGVLTMIPAFIVGMLVYKYYYYVFERRGEDSLQGLAFFFGLLFIIEVALLLVFGVDYRFVEASYIGPTISAGFVSVPLRLLVPLVVGLTTIGAIMIFMSRTYIGKAIIAVSQDPLALRLVGGNPVKIKEIAFGLSIATAVLSGALLIIIQPIEPSLGRDFIGRVFAIAVLGGMTSLPGTILASMILGVAESMTTTFFGPSWSPAVAFGLLLVTLAVKPAGILGR